MPNPPSRMAVSISKKVMEPIIAKKRLLEKTKGKVTLGSLVDLELLKARRKK